jgi:hypothetical protein
MTIYIQNIHYFFQFLIINQLNEFIKNLNANFEISGFIVNINRNTPIKHIIIINNLIV